MRNSEHNVPLSVVAGAAGGLVAAFAMNGFQAAWSSIAAALSPPQRKQESSGGENATVKTADAISEATTGTHLTDDQKKWAGPLVHYAFGTTVGAVYGLLASTVPVTKTGYGTVYGSAVWLFGDEIAVPALGLAGSPEKQPLTSHIQYLAAHLVYGVVTHITRKQILRIAA